MKVLTNMWLSDGQQHSFPVKTPEDNYLPPAKARLEKEFEYEALNKRNKGRQNADIFSSLDCKITEILSSPERKSVDRKSTRLNSSHP